MNDKINKNQNRHHRHVETGRIAIIDIGSNTVRLVVYDAPMRLPVPLFNEKVECELGRGLTTTGRLNQNGIDLALESIIWFTRLADAMGVEKLELVATAAVRDATDGKDFTALIKKRTGYRVNILSGDDESKAAAIGLLNGVPRADGILGDLGGGSLDLMELIQGDFGRCGTLPLGHLRLSEDAKGSTAKAKAIVADHLDTMPWIKDMQGRTFFAVGGSMRSIARIFMELTGYSLHIIDNFTVPTPDAIRMARLITDAGPKTLRKFPDISPKKIQTLPFAAVLLGTLLGNGRPDRLVFSGSGLREGRMINNLPKAIQKQDPLISGCMTLAERTGRFSTSGDELLEWTTPLFPKETTEQKRLRHGACLLSDLGWTEHPDYRAEHAFYRVLRLPYAGLSHSDRVFLAVAVFVRYYGDPDSILIAPVRGLLDTKSYKRARQMGLAFRLAHTLSGGAPGLLENTRLSVSKGVLKLKVSGKKQKFLSDTTERRLKLLASSLGLKANF
ncbi:MAG: exopolyphosphatase [Alphaproteobacteria bacterium]|nr:exopolyphosphatase [Alphaproteobacteria bacterium]MBT7943046.1 exopolyphosphatase [Alphaproteobacteria bacterium]